MNHERRRRHKHRWEDSALVRGHSVLYSEPGSEHTMDETQPPVNCPECSHKFRDVGSFIHHMWTMHEWESAQSLIYWGDHWRVDDAEKEV